MQRYRHCGMNWTVLCANVRECVCVCACACVREREREGERERERERESVCIYVCVCVCVRVCVCNHRSIASLYHSLKETSPCTRKDSDTHKHTHHFIESIHTHTHIYMRRI